jgi:hypothetical protein
LGCGRPLQGCETYAHQPHMFSHNSLVIVIIHCCTLPHCRTATHCCTHCHTLPPTAARCHAYCRTQPHCHTRTEALPQCRTLLHTAAPLHTHCRTAGHCRPKLKTVPLSDRCTLPCTLPYPTVRTATHRSHCRTATDCRTSSFNSSEFNLIISTRQLHTLNAH